MFKRIQVSWLKCLGIFPFCQSIVIDLLHQLIHLCIYWAVHFRWFLFLSLSLLSNRPSITSKSIKSTQIASTTCEYTHMYVFILLFFYCFIQLPRIHSGVSEIKNFSFSFPLSFYLHWYFFGYCGSMLDMEYNFVCKSIWMNYTGNFKHALSADVKMLYCNSLTPKCDFMRIFAKKTKVLQLMT